MTVSGIYLIRNNLDHNFYIGSSKDIHGRFRDHMSGRYSNTHLQRAISKYGRDKFSLDILEVCSSDKEVLQEREQYWIDSMNPSYNERKLAYRIEFTDKVRSKMSKASKGNKNWLGKKHTEETKKKISESSKGRTFSPEECKRRSDRMQGNKISGYKRSKLHRQLMSKAVSAAMKLSWARRKQSDG